MLTFDSSLGAEGDAEESSLSTSFQSTEPNWMSRTGIESEPGISTAGFDFLSPSWSAELREVVLGLCPLTGDDFLLLPRFKDIACLF